ncbi:MAG: hypothetical protein JWQ90_3576 [Hydrocarboniphaga sp.]|uniref:DUF2285 domain-containing protein n=1 Tax=Hydrocarboniphaga sp. TaxID=2033016 RepID=UPI002624BB0E|nr:DUF2285 domain-containing protein [Hydrocarboniphaga sp.]MDB5971126.1 hypothetical protein [Hydrocarboniphaga sp.]
MSVLHAHWIPIAGYLHILLLDGPSLAWEYLRRNPEYRRDWQRYLRRPDALLPERWGLRLFEDPASDARRVQPAWLPDPDGLVPLHADDNPGAEAPPFRLWGIPGRKQMTHDGRRLVLASFLGNQVIRLAIARELRDGMPYSYAVRAGLDARSRWRAVEAQLALLDSGSAEPAVPRPTRVLMAHMRSIQALDGVQAGASQREVAEALFGADEVADRWHADGELRAQVRHLIGRGREFMTNGYRRLLRLRSHP